MCGIAGFSGRFDRAWLCSVVAMAREIAPELRCFTIEIEGVQDTCFADDLPYARRVARRLDVALEVVTVGAARMAKDLETMVRLLNEPVADPAPLNVLYKSRLARERGIKVLFSGTGGDDLLSGYRRHLALRYEAMGRLLVQDQTGQPDGTYTIFGLMAVELWCRAFLDEMGSYRFPGQGKPVGGAFAAVSEADKRD